jgi:hypothetical protein
MRENKTDGRTGLTKLIGALSNLCQLNYIDLKLIDYFVSQSIDLDKEVDCTHACAGTHTHTHTHTNTEVRKYKQRTQTND